MAKSLRPWVFVSHSKRDSEGQLFLSHVFNLPESRLRPHFYGVDPAPPHAKSIRDWIRGSRALFFLLSDFMLHSEQSDYTRAWVGYEVGIASELGLPVVVIEPEVHRVDLPVPGATHYFRRPPAAQEKMGELWKAVAQSGCSFAGPIFEGPPIKGLSIARKRGGPKPGEVSGYLNPDTLWALDFPPLVDAIEKLHVFKRIVCRNLYCQATFIVSEEQYSSDDLLCPSCRGSIEKSSG